MESISSSTGVLEFISQPWSWAASGIAIAFVLFAMTWLGRSFGVSSSFDSLCTIAGAGKRFDYFKKDWKDGIWRLTFVLGAIIGGFIAANFLASPEPVALSQSTISHLSDWGIEYPSTVAQEGGYLPTDFFNFNNPLGIVLGILGGFMVGFGARYAGGCTSGHAISGLSHLQLPSLITVIGFFIGGLLMTWVIMPMIFG